MTLKGQIGARDGLSVEGRAEAELETKESPESFDEGRHEDERVAEPPRLDSIPLTKLIAYLIDNHHVGARRQVALISRLFSELSAAHQTGYPPELARVSNIFKALREKLLFHMEKEEVSLFPRIIRTEAAASSQEPQLTPYYGSAREHILMLTHEHDELRAELNEIRLTTNDYTPPDSVCPTYRMLYRALRDLELGLLQLFRLQDNILFPRALKAERHLEAL